jgi:hypothetical protein
MKSGEYKFIGKEYLLPLTGLAGRDDCEEKVKTGWWRWAERLIGDSAVIKNSFSQGVWPSSVLMRCTCRSGGFGRRHRHGDRRYLERRRKLPRGLGGLESFIRSRDVRNLDPLIEVKMTTSRIIVPMQPVSNCEVSMDDGGL